MPASKNKGLGKGFSALIPDDFDSSILLDANDRVQRIQIAHIQANNDQPRRNFDKQALSELSDSIKQYGILQPLIVTSKGKDSFEIIAGERRWRAAKEAGLSSVPAIVRSTKELEQLEIALVENVQRVDLSPLEQAMSVDRLHQQFNMTYEDIAKRLGKAVSTVHNIVRLLQLPKEAQTALSEKQISEGHARSILALKSNPQQQKELLDLIIRRGWSVRQAEQFVTAAKASHPKEKAATVQKKMQTESPQTKLLSTKLKSPVSIRHTARGGKLEISFGSDKELAKILSKLLKS